MGPREFLVQEPAETKAGGCWRRIEGSQPEPESEGLGGQSTEVPRSHSSESRGGVGSVGFRHPTVLYTHFHLYPL